MMLGYEAFHSGRMATAASCMSAKRKRCFEAHEQVIFGSPAIWPYGA